jgi:hypothetical protein
MAVLDSRGEELYEEYDVNSCLAVLSLPGAACGSGVWKEASTLKINFQAEVQWSAGFDHPLIQALAPGMEYGYDGSRYVITIPLANTPIDQIVCALRIVRSFDNVRHFVGRIGRRTFNHDGWPSVQAPVALQVYESCGNPLKERHTTSEMAGCLYSDVFDRWFAKRDRFFKQVRTDEEIITLLEAGQINPGWMPPITEGFGYLKAHYCVPVDKLYKGLTKHQYTEYSRYREVATKWQQAYLDKHGVHPFLSVDHSIALRHHPLTKEEFPFD